MMGRPRRQALPPVLPLPAPPVVEGWRTAEDTPELDIEWLIPGMAPIGVPVLLEGRKRRGKSTMLTALAACMTGGPRVPGWVGPRGIAVGWIGSEDRWETTVRRRLRAAGANLALVGELNVSIRGGKPRRPLIPDDEDLVRDQLIAHRAGLLLIDPVDAVRPPRLQLSRPEDCYTLMDSLSRIAFEACVTIIITRNLRKDATGDPLDHGLGGIALANRARAVLRLDRHPHTDGMHVLHAIACNDGAGAPGQCYRIVDALDGIGGIAWDGACNLDTDTLVSGQGDQAEEVELRDAHRYVYSMLKDGPRRAREVLDGALQAGVSEVQVKKARVRLGVGTDQPPRPEQPGWIWVPPVGGWPPQLVASEGVTPSSGSSGYSGSEGLFSSQKSTKKQVRKPKRTQNTQDMGGGQETPQETDNEH